MRLLPYLISASAVALCAFFADFAAAAEPEAINIGSQRELFIDGYLVDSVLAFPRYEALCAEFTATGFRAVRYQLYSGGIACAYRARTDQ